MTGPARKRTEPGRYVAALAWPEVAERIAAGAIGVVPVGAACKEHGPHLPLNTDQLQAEWIAQLLARNRNVLVWPTITYGSYPVFTDYPGSCTVAGETFGQCVYEILQGICNSGVKRILVLNTGISTIAPLEAALVRMPRDVQAGLFNAYSGPHFHRARAEVEEQDGGMHADEIETSIMLAIAPRVVNMDRAAAGIPDKGPGTLNRTRPQEPNYCPTGIIGDARLATAGKGKKLLDAILADLQEQFPGPEITGG